MEKELKLTPWKTPLTSSWRRDLELKKHEGSEVILFSDHFYKTWKLIFAEESKFEIMNFDEADIYKHLSQEYNTWHIENRNYIIFCYDHVIEVKTNQKPNILEEDEKQEKK